MRLVAALLLCSCAVGIARPDGSAYGIAVGQAQIQACRTDAPPELACSHIRGGAVSPEGAKALGPLSRLVQLAMGLL